MSARLKSLHEFLVESVDDELRERTGLDARAIMQRGRDRYYEKVFAEKREQLRREWAKAMPLLIEQE